MRLIKKVVIGLIILIIIMLFLIIGYLGPTDERLEGSFKSDKEATVKYLKTQKGFTDKQLSIVNQILGQLSFDFKGHKITRMVDQTNVEISANNANDIIADESIEEGYYFLKKVDEQNTMIVIIPSPWWDLKNTGIMDVEFDSDGFWLTSEILRSTGITYREKFTKQEK